jgi:hypothetical protein
MKKILIAATVALCFAGGSFAQENNENAGGDKAKKSADGKFKREAITGGVFAAGVLFALNSNTKAVAKDDVIIVDPICGSGEELIDGVCVPIVGPPVTNTVTTSNTLTSTITTPVTVTVTSTAL